MAEFHNWSLVLPEMVEVYLQQLYATPQGDTELPDLSPRTTELLLPTDTPSPASANATPSDSGSTAYPPSPANGSAVPSSPFKAGYIGVSPINPSLAISIKTLELYRQLHLRKVSFSAEAFAKVLCDYYMQIPYNRRYRQVLADAFDVYLQIVWIVDKRIQTALSRNGENWHVLNACPPCKYKLNEELSLVFS
ncbi:hypothetical protein PHLCEN_2v1892 [Hermanssonia centrifuga]|uniref:Uncharacterized protein n=1 Tax=Hermanssonia centrifuga TaxID=98765 RepID=A0A2R6RVL6_9APHY|nr:hypothetical protein PHLCEN_2v1892 [Hermanssonia centrifuga]